MNARKKLFWVLWQVPEGLDDSDWLDKWPHHMTGYLTGEGDGHKTYAGAVWALDAAEAERVVRSCYGKSSTAISLRGEPDEKPDDWEPTGGRFDLMAMPWNPNEESA